MRNFVPTEVKTPKKFSAKIYMFDFFFIIGFVAFGALTQNMVVPVLRVVFLFFNFAMGIFLSRKSQNNPGKRIYQSLWLYLRRPRTSYRAIEIEQESISTEGENNLDL